MIRPTKFFEVFENLKIIEYENVKNNLTSLLRNLLLSIDKNPDVEQKKQIIELAIQLTDKITGETNE